jgi:hypothetical protein
MLTVGLPIHSQRSLRVSEGAQKEALKARVRPHLEQMRLNAVQPYSKHLASSK